MNELQNKQYLSNFIIQLVKQQTVLEPCSNDDIEKIQSIVKPKELPGAYLEFMRTMGKYASFLRGNDYSINHIFDLRKGAEELLEENNSDERLTDDDFVFFMHQGYEFCFYKISEGDNPPVYFYSEEKCPFLSRGNNSKVFTKITDSLSEFFEGGFYR